LETAPIRISPAAEAFAVSEQAEARALVDLFQGDKVLHSKGLGDDERRREQELVE
jgi:hypothetical protein